MSNERNITVILFEFLSITRIRYTYFIFGNFSPFFLCASIVDVHRIYHDPSEKKTHKTSLLTQFVHMPPNVLVGKYWKEQTVSLQIF